MRLADRAPGGPALETAFVGQGGTEERCLVLSSCFRRSTMNKDDHKAVSAKGLMTVTVFYAISILLFPLTLIGYVIWVGKASSLGAGRGSR